MSAPSRHQPTDPITVYSKPACVQCTATYKALDKAGVDYEVVDITTNDDARDYVMSLGHLQAPVVVAGNQHWSGFRPDRVKAVAAQQRSSSPSPPDTSAAMTELMQATAAPSTTPVTTQPETTRSSGTDHLNDVARCTQAIRAHQMVIVRAAVPADGQPVHQWAPRLSGLLRSVAVEVHPSRVIDEVYILLTPAADAEGADAAEHAATELVTSPHHFGLLAAAHTQDSRELD